MVSILIYDSEESGSISRLINLPDTNCRDYTVESLKLKVAKLSERGPSSKRVLEVIFEEEKVEFLIVIALELLYLMKEFPEESVKLSMFKFVESVFRENCEIDAKVELVKVESVTLL